MPDPMKFSFEAHMSSDLAALQGGDYLQFSAVHPKYLSELPLSRLKTPGRLRGIVLSVHMTTEDSHRIQGCAVMVAPGVALCASHVFRDETGHMLSGKLKVLCVGTADHGNELWNIRNVTFVPNTDVCILSLSLIDGLPPDRTFRQASVTTRTPRLRERLFVIAFKAEEEDCINWKPGQKIRTNILVSAGEVTQHFPFGRGQMPPGACIEVDFASWSGMSGGPVFDEEGWLVGVLSSSLATSEDRRPSFVSLATSALACPFIGGWIDPGPGITRSLLSMSGTQCTIERPESITTSAENGDLHVFTTWQTR